MSHLSVKEINQNVLLNVLKMLENRGVIDNHLDEYTKIEKDIGTINEYEIPVKPKLESDNSQANSQLMMPKSKVKDISTIPIYSIYIVNSKINSVVQGSPLDEYLSNNINIHKIVITKDISRKLIKQFVVEYKNVEFFIETEMLIDITEAYFNPHMILLTPEQKLELKFPDKLPKIFNTDMMSRYYAAKIGDIFKIIRPTMTGYSIYYRRVENGNYDILFI
jgi:DNA-directed RNA polymerase subunit H (RpoH/RPB5)